MANEERDMRDPANWPLADPPGANPPDDVCDVCGAKQKNAQGVAMHKARRHSGNPWGHGGRKAAKGRSSRAAAAKSAGAVRERAEAGHIVLRERYADESGQMLLTDQNGAWWVAKKL